MPKVSVIVPVYNVEKYIRKCLKTLVNQTLKDIEIIVVDDGTKDKAADIVFDYKKEYPQIKYYKKENGGLADARNYGLQYATGKYIAFLDADDYVELDTYEKLYKKAKDENSDMVECNFFWTKNTKNKKDIGIQYSNKKEMLEKARVMAWNKLYKKSVLDEANVLFPKGLQYEDIEFFYKIIPYINKVSFVKQPLIHYVQRKESITKTNNKKTADIFKIFENIIEYYKEKRLYDEYKEEIEYSCIRILLCSSLRRISKIKDKKTRIDLQNETWIFLNTNFPNWRENRILNTKKNLKKMYLLSVNRFTYKIYCKIYKII